MRHLCPSALGYLLLAYASGAHGADSYDPADNQLAIAAVLIGGATYSDMVITVGDVSSGPVGNSPNGSVDSYNPMNRLLSVPSVMINGSLSYNYLGTVANLVSIGSVSGADTYDPSSGRLTIASVSVDDSAIYTDVVVSVGAVISIAGGMPAQTRDSYSSAANTLTIPGMEMGGSVYTNVTMTVGNVLSVGGTQTAGSSAVLYSFRGSPAIYGGSTTDGTNPDVSLIQGSDGNLYGTTRYGGSHDAGTVFRVTPGGMETVLYSFTGNAGIPPGTDGANPVGGLVRATDGTLYGTAYYGGTYGGGFLYAITPDGVASIPYSFGSSSTDGLEPSALIEGSDGMLYGSTQYGGTNGAGTVFRVTPGGSETVLHSFTGSLEAGIAGLGTDGANPSLQFQGSDGNFYGVTAWGGNKGAGIVFRIAPDGTETILYSFTGCLVGALDGCFPNSLIQGTDGDFYGTTQYGGGNGSGTVFRITPTGTETILYAFTGNANPSSGPIVGTPDGGSPQSLIQGTDGNFYGTTLFGGTYDQGTVFQITPGGVETVIHVFSGSGGLAGSNDGAMPSVLIQGADGNLYGTTYAGGTLDFGSLFRLTTVAPAP